MVSFKVSFRVSFKVFCRFLIRNSLRFLLVSPRVLKVSFRIKQERINKAKELERGDDR